jgi:hypothetical protein
MQKIMRVILPVILVLTILTTGTSIVIASDSSTPRNTTSVVNSVDNELINRLLALKDEATLDAALARLVANGTLTDQQSARIKTAWSNKQNKVVDTSIVKRLLAIKDEATLDAALARLVANGTLTDQQSARIKATWNNSR